MLNMHRTVLFGRKFPRPKSQKRDLHKNDILEYDQYEWWRGGTKSHENYVNGQSEQAHKQEQWDQNDYEFLFQLIE